MQTPAARSSIQNALASRAAKFLSFPMSCLFLAACAASPAVHADAADARAVSMDSSASVARYQQLTLDPVDLTVADGEHWKGVSEQQRAEAAKLVRDSFAKATAGNAEGQAAGEGSALRLHLTVEDVKLSSPVRSTIGHLLPIGLIINAGKSAAGASASSSMGSVTIAGELRDANTNALVASFWVQQGPDPMNFGAVFDQGSAMKAAIERTAEGFQAAVARARKGELACPEEASQTKTCSFSRPASAVNG